MWARDTPPRRLPVRWAGADSNPQPAVYKTAALPIELRRHAWRPLRPTPPGSIGSAATGCQDDFRYVFRVSTTEGHGGDRSEIVGCHRHRRRDHGDEHRLATRPPWRGKSDSSGTGDGRLRGEWQDRCPPPPALHQQAGGTPCALESQSLRELV